MILGRFKWLTFLHCWSISTLNVCLKHYIFLFARNSNTSAVGRSILVGQSACFSYQAISEVHIRVLRIKSDEITFRTKIHSPLLRSKIQDSSVRCIQSLDTTWLHQSILLINDFNCNLTLYLFHRIHTCRSQLKEAKPRELERNLIQLAKCSSYLYIGSHGSVTSL